MIRKAVLIGCNYIGTSAELRGCINDVLNVKSFLKSEFGFQDSEIRVLTEATENPANIPLRANIIASLNWLVANNNANSRLFLHFSGHGSYVGDRNGDETDRRDETICPLDYATAGMIVDDEIRKLIVETLNTGAKLFFLCDCCHSGTIADLKYTYKISAVDTAINYSITSDPKYTASKGNIMCVSGCTDLQTSADAYLDGTFQGAMTAGLLKTYKTLKADGKPLTYKRLMKGLLDLLQNQRFTQVPQICTGNFVDLGQTVSIV